MTERVGAILLPLVGDDQDTVDYIVAALLDAVSAEEYMEIIEPYVEEADDPAASLAEMMALLGVGGGGEGGEGPPADRGAAVLLQGGVVTIGDAEVAVEPPTTLEPEVKPDYIPELEDDADADAAGGGGEVGSKKGKKGRRKAKKDKPPVIDVSSQLSRYHTESQESTFTGLDIKEVCVSINSKIIIDMANIKFDLGKRYAIYRRYIYIRCCGCCCSCGCGCV